MAITFTQFMRPDGRQRYVWIDRTKEIEAMARELRELGYHFEIEILRRTGEVNMDCSRPEDDTPIAQECVENGIGVIDAVDRMIMHAYVRVTRGRAPAPPEPFIAAPKGTR